MNEASVSLATSAPAIGFSMSAAMLMMAKSVPFLTQTFLISLIWATSAGAMETKAPEPKPQSAAKVMMGALDLPGSHRASTMTEK